MTFMKSGSPFLYDDTTGDIVGLRDADGGETLVGNEGVWTPAASFAVAGTSEFSSVSAAGWYQETRNFIYLGFSYSATVTHTDASGILKLTGFPYAGATNAARIHTGPLNNWAGITNAVAGYTQYSVRVTNATAYMEVICAGDAKSLKQIAAADIPTGGTLVLRGNLVITR